MADEIKKNFSVEARMVKGKDGVFDVTVDGKLIFSKHSVGRFPSEDEILGQLRSMD